MFFKKANNKRDKNKKDDSFKLPLSAKDAALASIVGAIYVVLTLGFAPISFGPIQFRIAEILTVLPFLRASTAWGLFAGCLVANIIGGLGPWDIILGSLCTLIAAYLTSKMSNIWLAPLPPIVVNAFGVSSYLHLIFGLPYFLNVLYIGISETIICYVLGIPLLYFLKKQNFLEEYIFK